AAPSIAGRGWPLDRGRVGAPRRPVRQRRRALAVLTGTVADTCRGNAATCGTLMRGIEAPMSDNPRVISRRELLRGASIAGAAAAATGPLSVLSAPDAAAAPAPAQAAAPPPRPAAPREAFENLTAAEADILEAMVDRLIPSDALGPGAREARAAHYIDR